MAMRHGWITGKNHNPPDHFNSINLRQLMPDKTKKQIKQRQFKDCWAINNPRNSKTNKIEGVSLVEKHIADGNAEEANRTLGKLIFEEQVKPNLDVIAAGIEMDLINFVAEDIW